MGIDKEGRTTDELRSALMESPDLDTFLEENEDRFIRRNIQELLKELFLKTDLSKAELARRSGVSTVYLHQLFSGRRTPSRDRLICLAIGLSATLEETQQLLRRAGQAELYPRDRRDAILIYGIVQQEDLQKVNSQLFDANEETLV